MTFQNFVITYPKVSQHKEVHKEVSKNHYFPSDQLCNVKLYALKIIILNKFKKIYITHDKISKIIILLFHNFTILKLVNIDFTILNMKTINTPQ